MGESHDRQVEVSAVKANCVRFRDLAIELGLTSAELVTKSFRFGIKVITGDVANHQFLESEADLLRKSIDEPKIDKPEDGRSKKKKNKKKSKSKIEPDDLTTPIMFAEFYQKEIGEVTAFCNSYGFNIKDPSQRLTVRQINLLYKQFGIADMLAVDNLSAPLQSVFGELLRDAKEAPVIKPKLEVKASQAKQKNKRISVLAHELNIQEVTLRWLIDAVRANVIEGKQPKIDVKDESIIKTACEVWAQLPSGTNMVNRMRFSKIAKRSGAEIKDLSELCDEFNIEIQNKSFVSAADGVYLQALYIIKKVDAPAGRDDDVALEIKESLSEDRVQYRNANYVRQGFLGAIFKNSDFWQVNFGYADISQADFSGCSIRESQLTRVRAVGTIFDDTMISNCSFEFADLTDTSFLNSKLIEVSFRKATFANTKWIDGRLINSESEI